MNKLLATLCLACFAAATMNAFADTPTTDKVENKAEAAKADVKTTAHKAKRKAKKAADKVEDKAAAAKDDAKSAMDKK